MAEKEYTVVAPDGKEITLIGPAGASQEQIIAQAQKLYKPQATPQAAPQAQVVPQAQAQVPTTTSPMQPDVPLVASQMPKQVPIETKTSMMDKLKALYEVPATIGSSIVSQPFSMAYGVGAGAIEDARQGKMPTGESRDAFYRKARQATQFEPTSPASIDTLESIGGALEASKLPPYFGNIGAIPSAIQAGNATRAIAQQGIQNLTPKVRAMAQTLRQVPSVEKAAQAVEPAMSKIAEVLRKQPQSTMSGVGAAEVDLPTQRVQMAQELLVPMNIRKSHAERQLGQQKFESDIAKTYPETLGKDIIKSDMELNDAMLKNFDAFIDATGAQRAGQFNLRQVGNVVDKALVKNAEKAWNETNNAYKVAREAGEMEAPVSYAPLEAYIAKQTPTVKSKLAPILDAVDEQIQANDPKINGNRSGNIPINSIEDIYEFINKHYEPDTPAATHAIEMKNIIKTMMEGQGGELYQKARKLRMKYANEFENVGYVDKLLRNKPGTTDRAVALADVFDHAILKGSLEDTRNVALALKKSPEGQQAWKELQGQTIQHIKDLVTKNMTKDSSGQVTIAPKRFNSIVNELDQEGKLDYIFGKPGAQQIRNLNEVSSTVFDPLTGAVNYSGSGSAIIQGLERIAKATRLPGLGKIAEVAKNRELKKKVEESVNYTPNSMAKALKGK